MLLCLRYTRDVEIFLTWMFLEFFKPLHVYWTSIYMRPTLKITQNCYENWKGSKEHKKGKKKLFPMIIINNFNKFISTPPPYAAAQGKTFPFLFNINWKKISQVRMCQRIYHFSFLSHVCKWKITSERESSNNNKRPSSSSISTFFASINFFHSNNENSKE